MSRLSVALLALSLAGCAARREAHSVCSIDGGARAGVPLVLTAGFGFSGCVPTDAVCTVTVDGGIVFLRTSATLCSTGCNPGGVLAEVSCTVPPLEPGTYALEPFAAGTLVVNADGGGETSCSNPGF